MHTYNKYLFLFTLLSLLSNHIPSTYSELCVEKSLFSSKQQYKNCPQVDDSKLFNNNTNNGFNLEQSDGSSSMIKILFKCDEVKEPKLCKKANIAFNNAADIVSNTFDLKVPIIVDASFIQLCGTLVQCPKGQPIPLGAAGPTRLIPLTDDDGAVRLYPQALVKQFQLSQHPEFSESDITAGFNSESDIFWFRGDPEIGKDQVDFEIVLVHEFLHGLGFIFSWDDYLNPDNPNVLTPSPSFIDPSSNSPVAGSFSFTGFQEYAFDKHLILTKDNSSLVLVTDKMNQFAKTNSNFADEKEFISAFAKSPEFIIAQEMFNNSITRNTVAFKFPEGDDALIETSLVPFRAGSSFSHFDFDTLSNTTDFLMRFKAPRQVTLDDLTSINGNDPDYTNPIGPKTIRMFQSIGYSVKENASSFKITENSTQPNTQNIIAQPIQGNIQYNSANIRFSFTTNILLILSLIISALLF